VSDQNTYKLVGWLYWHKVNPSSKLFTTQPLDLDAKEAGYLSQPVYVDTREEP
jgi:hypothetical protein